MKNSILSVVAVFSMATAAFAESDAAVYGPVISGEVSLDFSETANNNYGGGMSVDLDVSAGSLATVALGFTAVDGAAVSLDTWTVGMSVNGVDVAIGDENGVMPGAEGEHTLTAPAMTESVQVSTGAAAVAIGFTDWTTDVSDISNVQGAYTLGTALANLTVAADYNIDSKNTVLGAGIGGVDVGELSLNGAVSYDVDAEVFGFETWTTIGGTTVYFNGDDTEVFQNIGGSYEVNVAGATLSAGANYDLVAKDIAPTVGLSFNF
jgi:hypothetical protein